MAKSTKAFEKFYIATDCDSTFTAFNDSYYSASGKTPEEAVKDFHENHNAQPKFIYEVTKRFVVETVFMEG